MQIFNLILQVSCMCSYLLISCEAGSLFRLFNFSSKMVCETVHGDRGGILIPNATSIKTPICTVEKQTYYLETPLRKYAFHTEWIICLNVKGLSTIFCVLCAQETAVSWTFCES